MQIISLVIRFNFRNTKPQIIKYSTKNIVHKRTMFSRAAHTTNIVSPRIFPNVIQRSYPGKYNLIRVRKNVSADELRRFGITYHEATHDNIQDTKTKKIEGIMTSSQNKDGKSPAVFDKISPEKVNGSFTPLKDPKTKQPILDNNGNPIPDPNKGGQYMATFPRPRILSKDAEHLFTVNKAGQNHVDKHEDDIKAIINKNRKHYRPEPSKKIGGADEE